MKSPAALEGGVTTDSTAETRRGALYYLALAALGLASWLLVHPYEGLFHDANLYALQALARLAPAGLSHDVFLNHASQDRFTLFSPLYAGVIRLLGLDRAAAVLTGLSQVLFCAAAWWLARGLLPRWAAGAGVVLLLCLPGTYGPLRIFACIEPFLTPRMAAEALTLGALAAGLRRRGVAMACLMGLALLIHPLMALAGVSAWLANLLLRHAETAMWRATGIAVAIIVIGLLVALLAGGRFDGEWLSIIQSRSPYLFASAWPMDDVGRALLGVLPLAMGARVFVGPLRRACLCVLLTAGAGWLMTLLGADLAHAVWVTQAQPWRLEWLASTASALLLPFLLVRLWRSMRERLAALLLIAAWLLRPEVSAAPIGLVGLAALWLPALDARHQRLLTGGALALCVLAAVWRVASNLEFTDAHYLSNALPGWLREAMSFSRDGLLLAALVAAAIGLEATRARRVGQALLLTIGIVTAIATARYTLPDWALRDYPSQRWAAFAPWRALVPADAQVLWPQSPLSAWALLNRAHYLSALQSSGVVFSRATAVELKRRAERLAPALSPANFLQWQSIGGTNLSLSPGVSLSVCHTGAIDYLITEQDLGEPPVAMLPRADSKQVLRLYRCSAKG